MKNSIVFFWKFWAGVTVAQVVLGGSWFHHVFQGEFGNHPFDQFIARELIFGQVMTLGFAVLVTAVWLLVLAYQRLKDPPAVTLAI